MEDSLTSAEAARLLGVGPTTIKRWADEGVLPCLRTAGHHRRFLRVDVERLLRRDPASAPDRVGSWLDLLTGTRDIHAVHGRLLQERADAGSWWAVADGLGEVLQALGQRWAMGALSVAEEHQASEQLARGLTRCTEALLLPPGAPQCVLAAAEGDQHTMGLRLVELCAVEAGWRPLWLGAPTPTVELIRAVEALAPDAVAVSASSVCEAAALAPQARKVAEVARRIHAEVWLGGTGGWPEGVAGTVLLRSVGELRRHLEARRGQARQP